MKNISLSFFCVLLMASSSYAEEPPLPVGLGAPAEIQNSDEPALPAGLGGSRLSSDEPVLPMGLEEASPVFEDDDFYAQEEIESDSSLPFDLSGFAEVRAGHRSMSSKIEKDASIGEARLQLQAEKYWNALNVRVTGDFLYDPIYDRYAIDLEKGEGFFDLREAFVNWRAADFMDVKAGRQILTWGTGDLAFLNDLFPKDYNSFFIGRDEEYLKAPSDALKIGLFSDLANLDLVYMPNFDANRYADGSRVSVYSPLAGGIVGSSNAIPVDRRGKWFDEDEWAARMYRNFGAYEIALYGYYGYWKNPQGLDMTIGTGRAMFPSLSVYGGSVRGPMYKGIANTEIAYYDSRSDRDGDNPFLPNDQFRFLAGYEQEIAKELTAGVQYNLERTLNYSDLKRTAMPGPRPEDNRHIITLRLTKQLLNQNLTLSLFNFYCISESDGYARPKINYKVNDEWTIEAGGNIFYGESRDTFFGQLEDNTNAYVSIRFSF